MGYGEEWVESEKFGRMVRWVTTPAYTALLPDPERATGDAVLIAPGGSYNNLVIEHEGFDVAQEFLQAGTACFILKYRHLDRMAATQDAWQALSLIRSQATDYHINPDRIGMLGFSAGADLAMRTAGLPLDPERRAKQVRPDFLLLVYPMTIEQLPENMLWRESFPRTFIVSGGSDDPEERVTPLVNRLRELNVPVEAHIFAGLEHGFGPGKGTRAEIWPRLGQSWIRLRL